MILAAQNLRLTVWWNLSEKSCEHKVTISYPAQSCALRLFELKWSPGYCIESPLETGLKNTSLKKKYIVHVLHVHVITCRLICLEKEECMKLMRLLSELWNAFYETSSTSCFHLQLSASMSSMSNTNFNFKHANRFNKLNYMQSRQYVAEGKSFLLERFDVKNYCTTSVPKYLTCFSKFAGLTLF